jgi:hypothetical protein
MWATKRVLILSAVLLAVPPARADKMTFADPLLLVAPKLPPDGQLRFEDLGIVRVVPVDRRSIEPSFKREIQDVQGNDVRFAVDPRVGLHWDATGQRPSLVYQFSDNGVMRLRGSRHSVGIRAIWSF